MERANGYLESSFLPGLTFTGPDDFNTQLTAWLKIANRRQHRTRVTRPIDRWEADRSQTLPGPGRPPASTATAADLVEVEHRKLGS